MLAIRCYARFNLAGVQRSGNDAGQVDKVSALQRKVMDAHTRHNKLKTKLQLVQSSHKKVEADMQAQYDQLKKDYHDTQPRIEGQESELKRLRREKAELQKLAEKHTGILDLGLMLTNSTTAPHTSCAMLP